MDDHSFLNIIASIVQQLRIYCPDLINTEVAPLFEKHKSTRSNPSLEEYLGLLDGLCMRCSSGVYIVIDALDECTDGSIKRKTVLRELQKDRLSIRLLVTSRDIPTIAQQLPLATRLKVEAREEDILSYIEERISNAERLKMLLSKEIELRENMKRLIAAKLQECK